MFVGYIITKMVKILDLRLQRAGKVMFPQWCYLSTPSWKAILVSLVWSHLRIGYPMTFGWVGYPSVGSGFKPFESFKAKFIWTCKMLVLQHCRKTVDEGRKVFCSKSEISNETFNFSKIFSTSKRSAENVHFSCDDTTWKLSGKVQKVLAEGPKTTIKVKRNYNFFKKTCWKISSEQLEFTFDNAA